MTSLQKFDFDGFMSFDDEEIKKNKAQLKNVIDLAY